MKRVIAAALLAVPMANAQAICLLGFIGTCPPQTSAPAPAPAPAATATVAAPEIDGASGALALALAGGVVALLQRSRRRKLELPPS